MLIGDAARYTGVSVRMLRHYDAVGLVRPTGRTIGGYRDYSDDDVRTILQVKALRSLGLTLKQIGRVLEDPGRAPAALVDDLRRRNAWTENANCSTGSGRLRHPGPPIGRKPYASSNSFGVWARPVPPAGSRPYCPGRRTWRLQWICWSERSCPNLIQTSPEPCNGRSLARTATSSPGCARAPNPTTSTFGVAPYWRSPLCRRRPAPTSSLSGLLAIRM